MDWKSVLLISVICLFGAFVRYYLWNFNSPNISKKHLIMISIIDGIVIIPILILVKFRDYHPY